LAASRNKRLVAVDPEADSEAMRLLSDRREDLVGPSVHEHSTACTDSLGTSSPAGWAGSSLPIGPLASYAA
jgi:hypothetical protein